MIIIVGIGYGDPCSNPGRGCLHFTYNTNTFGKGENRTILLKAIGK